MKQIIKSFIAIALLTLGTNSYAGDTFTSDDARCSITFPGSFEMESENGNEQSSITVTGIDGGMIYMLIATIYSEPIAEDENDLQELISLYTFAQNTETKIKDKNLFSFNVGNQKGYYGFMKPKLNGNKYMGNYYVIIRDNILYQFTALAPKKQYLERPANKFADSFQFR